ncbi:hypothetical protein C0995_005809 [Termitomyces sp. Mi166|nr:hypothetical protein C0995_005809 [Termitomyces sp. Mi166\
MAARTSTNRLSAVYIGPPHIPDLPLPPSPSSSTSGLPSPPATNSTGSGGDEKDSEKVLAPLSRGHRHSTSISSVASVSISSVVKGPSILEETLPLPDEGDDDTARFDTLQRVKSLKERNRLVLDKLSSHSPAPSSSSSTSSHGPQPHHASPSPSSLSHSRSGSYSHTDPRSGSETERESTYSRSSTTHHRAFSLATTPQHDTQPHRSRVPSTPNEASTSRSSASGSGSSGRRRLRLALLEDGTARLRERAEEILDGATRRRESPAAGSKKRGALPVEFRRTSTQDPSTPLRAPSLASHSSTSTSRSKRTNTRYSFDLASQSSSSRSSHSRSSYHHSHSQSDSASLHSQPQPQPQSQSQTNTPNHTSQPRPIQSSDPRSIAFPSTTTTTSRRGAGTPILGMTAYRERRQTLRGGSAESALSQSQYQYQAKYAGAGAGRRTLIGEELRAAGLSPTRKRVGRGGRLSLGWDAEAEAGAAGAGAERAVSSLALFGDRDRGDEGGGEGVREERELRERERSVSRVDDRDSDYDRDTTFTASTALMRLRTTGTTPNAFGSRRHAQTRYMDTEHTRLLGESLSVFEGHLVGRFDGDREMVRNAQSVVGAAIRLNEVLRMGSARALDEQVRAEVDGEGHGTAEVWGRVGGEYREGLRGSDEVVRGLTGLLLGLGRVLREFGGGEAGVGEGVQTQHGRSGSVDEGVMGRVRGGRMSPGAGSSDANSVSGSGRRSVESRRSWDASATLALREDVARRLGAARTESALGVSRPGTAFSTLREREKETLPSSSTRRLLTPREQREMQMGGTTHSTPGSAGPGGMPTIHSQETFYGEYEPSPTPVSRTTTLDRSRTLGIPKPLPSLPSETSLKRTTTLSETSTERELRKVSIASTSTVRGTTSTSTSVSASVSAFPVTAPAAATTAVTPHTVSTQTPDRTAFPSLPRTDSERSVRSSVTFSRPSTVSSVSALVDVRQQDTQRRRTASGGVVVVDPSASDPVRPTREREGGREAQHQHQHQQQQQQQQSGSERERPKRRMQVGKMSLDANGKGTGTGNASDRSAVIAANAIVASKVGVSGGRGPPPPVGVGLAKRDRDRRRTLWKGILRVMTIPLASVDLSQDEEGTALPLERQDTNVKGKPVQRIHTNCKKFNFFFRKIKIIP